MIPRVAAEFARHSWIVSATSALSGIYMKTGHLTSMGFELDWNESRDMARREPDRQRCASCPDFGRRTCARYRSRQMKSVRAMDCERLLEAERAVGVRPETPPTPALRRRKSEAVERPCSQMEGQQWIGALSRSISLDEKQRTEGVLPAEFSLAQLPVALIHVCDHISIRHKEYGATSVERYCRRFAIVRRREDRLAVQPVDGQETLGDRSHPALRRVRGEPHITGDVCVCGDIQVRRFVVSELGGDFWILLFRDRCAIHGAGRVRPKRAPLPVSSRRKNADGARLSARYGLVSRGRHVPIVPSMPRVACRSAHRLKSGSGSCPR